MDMMDARYGAQASLQSVFESARSFGLTDAEAWKLLDWCRDEVGDDAPVGEFLDELVVTLGRCILSKERRTASRTRA